jgi:hypothetical protein
MRFIPIPKMLAAMLAGIAKMWLRHPLPAVSLLEQAVALNPSLALAHAQ